MLRSIPPSLDPEVVAAIDARLIAVEREQKAVIAIAIESGSRAWGFPSPDSDYDCRFIYVRHEEEYLSPWLRRDVIETPLDAIFDVSGWDLGKTLKLLLKGNAVAIEWLMSPIVYRADAQLREELLRFAGAFVERHRIVNHYRRAALLWLAMGEAERTQAQPLGTWLIAGAAAGLPLALFLVINLIAAMSPRLSLGPVLLVLIVPVASGAVGARIAYRVRYANAWSGV